MLYVIKNKGIFSQHCKITEAIWESPEISSLFPRHTLI